MYHKRSSLNYYYFQGVRNKIRSQYSSFNKRSPKNIHNYLQKASFESSGGDSNICSDFKDTVLWDVFDKMNKCNDHEIRKLSAYIICILTYNNFAIQHEIWRHFGFTPIDGIMIFNQIPSQLIVEVYFENWYLTNG